MKTNGASLSKIFQVALWCTCISGSAWGWVGGTTSFVWSLGGQINSTPAIGTNGNLYVGNSLGNFFELNPIAGTTVRQWTAGGWLSAAPSIGTNGIIYAGCEDNKLYAFSPDGTTQHIWTTANKLSSTAIGADGTIYVGSGDQYVYAFNPDGTTQHMWNTGGYISAGVAVGADGLIFAGPHNTVTKFYAFNPDGTTQRVWNLPGNLNVCSSPTIGPDGTVYITAQGVMYALNQDGTTNFVCTLGGFPERNPLVGPDGTIYIGSSNGYYTIRDDGTTNRFWNLTSSGGKTSGGLASDGTWYAVSDASRFYALSPDGTTNKQWLLGGVNLFPPTISSNGTVYVGCTDGKLYAFTGNGSSGAESAWPCYRHDVTNTARVPGGIYAPGRIRASDGLYTDKVGLSWRATTNATGYRILRSQTSVWASASALGTSVTTNYDDTTAVSGTVYYYWIQATNATQSSVMSAYDIGWRSQSGLLGYWPLNGNVDDCSGNGNHGTVLGAALTTDRRTNANAAYYFNGSSDRITVGDPAVLDMGTNDYSISLWLKSTNSGTCYFIHKGAAGSQFGYSMYLTGGRIASEIASTVSGVEIIGPTTYNDGQWHHVVMTADRDASGCIYVDGVLYANTNITSQSGSLDSTNTLYFSDYMNGSLDDIRMYNYVLTQQEISVLYGGIGVTNGLVVYWPFSGNALDATGRGHTGVVYNGASLTTDRFGNPSSAYNFDGTNDHIRVTNSPDFALTNCTISAWVKPVSYQNPSASEQDVIISSISLAVEEGGIQMHLSTNCFAFVYRSPGQSVEPSSSPVFTTNDNGQWHFLAASFERVGTNSITRLYLDGALSKTFYQTNAAPVYSNQILYIGINCGSPAAGLGQTYIREFNGAIDDVRIYNRCLGDAEVTALYDGPQTPTGVAASDGLYSNKVMITWNVATNASGYSVWRNTSTNVGGASVIGAATNTTYDDSSATAGTTYYYWIKATNAFASGGFGGPDSGWRSVAVTNATNGLVAYWPFSGNAADATGRGHTGVVYNGATLTSDRFGNPNSAYNFDGTNDHIRVTNSPDFALTNCTISAWVKPVSYQNPSASQQDVILSTIGLAVEDGGIQMHLSTNCFVFVYRSPGQSVEPSSSPVFATNDNGQWHFLAATLECTGTSTITRLYLDGALSQTFYKTNAPPVYSNQILYIGINMDSPAAGLGRTQVREFNGAIDEVRIYNCVLNGSEILALYDYQAGPSSVAASDGTYTNSVRVTWNAVTNATGYEVWRHTSNSSGSASKIGAATSASYDDSSVTVGMTYYYWIKATNASIVSAFSASDSGYAALAAPAAIAASDGTPSNSIVVTWSAVSGANGYELFRQSASGTGMTFLAGTTALTYTDSAISQGQIYYYWVRATNAYVAGATCGPDTGWTPVGGVTSVSASDGTHTNKIAVTWSSVTNAAGYLIWRGTNNSVGSAGQIAYVSTANYNDSAVSVGTLYYYWVKATNAMSVSGFSGSDSGWMCLAAPSRVHASYGTYTDKILLTWGNVESATGYEVWRAAGNNASTSSAARIQELTATEYSDTAADAGSVYTYWVKAKNSLGTSAFSTPDYGYRAIATNSLLTITASAGTNGAITPSGVISIQQGGTTSFVISANSGAHIVSVVVDGVPVGTYGQADATATYTFSNVTSNRTIAASFNRAPTIVVTTDTTGGTLPLRVTFDFTDSTDADGSIARCEVDKDGDGRYETSSEGAGRLVVEYNEAGSFTSMARVTDNSGASVTAMVTITVEGTTPTAALSATLSSGMAPLSVALVGTNSRATTGRTLVVYEFDVNGDGVYDRISRYGTTTWTYREAGVQTVVLRVTDDAGAQDTDSETVTVTANTNLPPAVALAAQPRSGDIPLTVALTATVTNGVGVTNYNWDTDGDGCYDLRTTANEVTNVYRAAGTYSILVQALSVDGLAGTASGTVVATESESLRVWLTSPRDGADVWGRSVSVKAHAAPASRTDSVLIQYRAATATNWTDIGDLQTPPPYSYSETWNVTGLTDGAEYDLRALAWSTSGGVVTSDLVRVTVDRSAGGEVGDVVEDDSNGRHSKSETFSQDEEAEVEVYDGTRVTVPMGAVESNITVTVALIGSNSNGNSGARSGHINIGENREISIAGNPDLNAAVTLVIPYEDEDDNGYVDGTHVQETTLTAYWYDTEDQEWKRALTSEVHADENYVEATTYHLTEFGLFGALGNAVSGDYDGDGKADYALYNEESGYWGLWYSSSGGYALQQFGAPGYAPVQGDYDQDYKTDLAIYDASSGYWFVRLSANDGMAYVRFGGPGYTAISADFDGDGKADPAVYCESSGFWYLMQSADAYRTATQWFGGEGYEPVPADFDGDSKADLAVYGEDSGYWAVVPSATKVWYTQWFGAPGYEPAPGDYDGDGKADYAVYNEASGNWYVLPSGTGKYYAQWHGAPGYAAVAADFDGDGKTDLAVYHEATGYWYVRNSTSDTVTLQSFGAPGYQAVR